MSEVLLKQFSSETARNYDIEQVLSYIVLAIASGSFNCLNVRVLRKR